MSRSGERPPSELWQLELMEAESIREKCRASLWADQPVEGPPEVAWMDLQTFARRRWHLPFEYLQHAVCERRGQHWVRPIVGRYRDRRKEHNDKRIRELLDELRRVGGCVVVERSVASWRLAEWLENALEFELRPPCGCPPRSGE